MASSQKIHKGRCFTLKLPVRIIDTLQFVVISGFTRQRLSDSVLPFYNIEGLKEDLEENLRKIGGGSREGHPISQARKHPAS